jgi:hypothetical protein
MEKGEGHEGGGVQRTEHELWPLQGAAEGELKKLSGVERSNADPEKGIVEVSYDEGWITTEQLKGAIENTGYIATT